MVGMKNIFFGVCFFLNIFLYIDAAEQPGFQVEGALPTFDVASPSEVQPIEPVVGDLPVLPSLEGNPLLPDQGIISDNQGGNPQLGVGQGGVVEQAPTGNQTLGIPLAAQPFILKDEDQKEDFGATSEALYLEARTMYERLFNQQLDLNKIVQQHILQESTLHSEVDLAAKSIGQKGGKIKGLSDSLKTYVTAQIADISGQLQIADAADKVTLTNILNKIKEVEQALRNWGASLGSIETEYKQVQNLQNQIRQTNQQLQQKEYEYAGLVSQVGSLKAQLVQENTIEAHRVQVETIRKIQKDAEQKAQEIKAVQFDAIMQVRDLIKSIDGKLNGFDQQLQVISTNFDGIMDLIKEHVTRKEKEMITMIKNTTDGLTKKIELPQVVQETKDVVMKKRDFRIVKNLFKWVREYASDVKNKLLYTSESGRVEVTKPLGESTENNVKAVQKNEFPAQQNVQGATASVQKGLPEALPTLPPINGETPSSQNGVQQQQAGIPSVQALPTLPVEVKPLVPMPAS